MKLVQEVPHAFLAERHAATDGHAFAQLERGDGLLGAGHHGLLSGNDGQFVVWPLLRKYHELPAFSNALLVC